MGERILIETGSHSCHNMGDVAMMQIAVERIRQLWPGAQIEIVTRRPDLLARFAPTAVPIPLEERNAWLSARDFVSGFLQKLPPVLSTSFSGMGRAIWLHLPHAADSVAGAKARLRRREFIPPENFRRRLRSASLFVVCGMGAMNDSFSDAAIPLLDEMEAAIDAGVPVIAFGQGIGPITDPMLLQRARAVLPRLTLISLRESVMGLPLLKKLGVREDRIIVTGDDTVEMAFRSRPARLGNAIGISLRLAGYAGTDHETIGRISGPLHAVAEATQYPLVAVPISFAEHEADVNALGKILGDRWQTPLADLSSPEEVIRIAGGCRTVVTGTYHAGVFALSQGIPIVGLIQSSYYEQKLKGLQQQFPDGCQLVDLRQPVSPQEIESTIIAAIESAERVRESLFAAAARQVDLGRHAYEVARELCPLDPLAPGLSRPSSSHSGAEISVPDLETGQR